MVKIYKTFLFLLLSSVFTSCVSIKKNREWEVTDYTSFNTIFNFNDDGEVVSCNINDFSNLLLSKYSTPRLDSRLNTNGEFEIFDSFTNNVIYTSDIGERIFLVASDNEDFYFYTNAESNYYRLEKFNLNKCKFEVICEKNCDFENIVSYLTSDGIKLSIANFSDGSKIYFEDRFCRAEKIIKNRFSPYKIHWESKSPKNDTWIVSLSYSERPNKTITYSFKNKNIVELYDSFANWENLTNRSEITILSRDNKKISTILTYRNDLKCKKKLPVVVFPHGGPGSKTDLTFDFRAHYLAREGFLVIQPNYRGSEGFGKIFRFSGFGCEGIKKAQEDIEDTVKYLIENEIADKDKIAILGGSWGAYCAAYALTFTPKYYKAGVLFFGAYDLPTMLESFPIKSKAHKALDMLQYGKLPQDRELLKSISPIHAVSNIQAPILIYHFFNDEVIEYSQGETFVNELKKYKKSFEFISGDGEHGFPSDEAEEEVYMKLIKFIKEKLETPK